MEGPLLVQDTSVLLNLLATDCFEEIARAAGRQMMICPHVRWEALFLRDFATGERRPVNLESLIEEKFLSVTDLRTGVERQQFVFYAQFLDDGEAASAAVAACRSLELATDDRKAIRVFREHRSDLRIWTTPDLIHRWSESPGIDGTRCRRVIERIEQCARYRPPHDHRLASWWRFLRE